MRMKSGDMVEKFFYGIDRTTISAEIDVPHALISIATLWDGCKLKNLIHLDAAVQELFLDSGGFSFFTKWAKYPFSTELYVYLVRQFCRKHPQTRYVSVMDYPCEDYVNRSGLKTNIDRIDATIENTKELFKHQIPAEWVAVIQGHSEQEYAYCCKQMSEYDLWTPLTAIGSICTRLKLEEIKRILRLIQRYNPGVNLHAFGLEYRAIADREVWNHLYSVDSAAWRFTARKYKQCSGAWRPGTDKEKLENLNRYKAMVANLFAMRNGNETIQQYTEEL